MKKYKIIFENHCKETGETVITIRNKYGTFTGVTHLADEDRDYYGKMFGFRIAETKAKIKYYKHRAKLLNEKRNYYIELYNMLVNSGEDPKSSALRKIRKAMYVTEKEIRNWYQKADDAWKIAQKSEQTRKESLDNFKNKDNNARREILKMLYEKTN